MINRSNKIHQPQLNEYVLRENLIKRTIDNSNKAVTAVIAPPGYGKTTLISSYLNSKNEPSVWYSVDDSDADFASFFPQFSLGIRKATPKKRKPIPEYHPGDAMNIKVFARRYFNAIYKRFDSPFSIVFDDFHECKSSMWCEVINIAINELPKMGKLFIISRESLPSQFARLNINQQINLIQGDDLRFSDKETAELASIHNISELTSHQYTEAQAMMVGWAAGLSLLFTHLKQSDPCVELEFNAEQDLFNYFMNEVFSNIKDELKNLLYRTCMLTEINVKHAVKLSGNPRAGDMLKELYERSYFTYRISTKEKTYRFHPLFREFIQHQSEKQLGPETFIEIRNKSITLLEQDQAIVSAAKLVIQGGEWKRLAEFVTRYAPNLMSNNQIQTLQNWLQHIPEALFVRIPWLTYWRAVCFIFIQPQGARQYFIAAHDGFKEHKDVVGQCLSLSGVIESYIIERDSFSPLDEWIEHVDKIFESIENQIPAPVASRLTIAMFTGLVHRAPQHRHFDLWLKRVINIPNAILSPELRIMRQVSLILHYLWQGDFRRAESIYDRIEPEMRQHPDPGVKLRWYLIQIFYLWFTGNGNDQALTITKEALKFSREYGLAPMEGSYLIHGAAAAVMAKKYDLAGNMLQTISQHIDESMRSQLALYYKVHAVYKLQRGDIHSAFYYMQESLRYAECSGSLFYQATTHFTQAQLHYLVNDLDNTKHHLAVCKSIADQTKSYFHQFLIKLFQASIEWSAGTCDLALDHLKHAMELASKHNLSPNLWIGEKSLREILSIAIDRQIESNTANSILKKCNLTRISLKEREENKSWPVRIYTLGCFEIYLNDELFTLPSRNRPKVFSLLKVLIAFGGQQVHESTICDVIWPDADGDAAHRLLNTTVFRLRKLLGFQEALVLKEGKLSLNKEVCWLDTWAFNEEVAELTPLIKNQVINAYQIKSYCGKIEEYYKGDFLPADELFPIVNQYRQRMQNKWNHLLFSIAESLNKQGEIKSAFHYLEIATKIAPLEEKAYRILMKLHLSEGNLAEAITVYETCKNALQSGLGVKPSKQTEEVFAQIKTLGNSKH